MTINKPLKNILNLTKDIETELLLNSNFKNKKEYEIEFKNIKTKVKKIKDKIEKTGSINAKNELLYRQYLFELNVSLYDIQGNIREKSI